MIDLTAIAAKAARAKSIFLHAGPVGLIYACQLWWYQRRMTHLEMCIARENELHRINKANLRNGLNQSIYDYQATQVAAAVFWRHCEKQNTAGSQP